MATGLKEVEVVKEVEEVEGIRAVKPVKDLEKVENDDNNLTGNFLKVVAKTAIGATIGIAGGLALVTFAAVAEGTILSYVIFTKVLGIAGGAAGLAHGVSSVHQDKKKMKKK